MKLLIVITVSFVAAFAPLPEMAFSGRSLTRSIPSPLDAVGIPSMIPAEEQDEEQGLISSFNNDFKQAIIRRTNSSFRTKIKRIDTIQEYKDLVVDETEKIVVVRFFASWCTSCKAAEPQFMKIVSKFSPAVKFVEVPLNKETAYLQEGLGVPSVPFAHIYYPSAGLVEEMKLSKPHIREFESKLNSYILGYCDFEEYEERVLFSSEAFQ